MLPPDTQRSSCSQSANESSTKNLLRTTTRCTSLEEKSQDREVLEDDTIALNLQGIQSGVINFGLPFAVVLLSQIAETANPPLLPGLKNIDYVHTSVSWRTMRSSTYWANVYKKNRFQRFGALFVEAKYVSRPLAAFKLYMNQCFQRFLSAREDNKPYYGLYLSIVQSSGTGKSRLISELGRNDVFVVHMTLRDRTDKGFPPRDDIPANFLADKNAKNSREYESRCSAFFASVFKTLESTIQEICTTKRDGRGQITFSQCVEGWQHEFGSFAPRRGKFFAKVQNTFDGIYNTLEMRNISLSDNSVDRKSVAPGSGCRPAKDAGLAFSGKEVMMDACKSLVHVIKGLLPKVTAGGTDPEMKVMLGFDEASILGDEQGCIYSNEDRYPIWAIFASTNSRIANFGAPRKIDPSLRVPVGAPKFSLDSGNWPVLNDANHICGFGRPLWSTMIACTPISELVAVAKWKLMLAHGYDNTRAACSLALVFQRFALDVVFGHLQTVKYVETSVVSHMRICISVTEDRSWKETCYPSEPLLSHVAADVMWEWDHVLPDVLFHLKNHIESGMIDIGKNGELVCRLLLLFAKDHYLSRSSTGIPFMDTPEVEDGHLRYCSAIPVNEWLTRLFGKKAWPTDMEQNVRARQTFNHYEVNFSHWGAKRLYFRTSAVQCADRQPLIDQLIIIRKKGTNYFSHVCISDKNGGTQDQADVSYIHKGPGLALKMAFHGLLFLWVSGWKKPASLPRFLTVIVIGNITLLACGFRRHR
ncbi:hypothetical protein BU17DRAFT_69389 [Hysterangium stoloniferum]|nr:hypothetical protein BU17DRAFT_69389 [Hysterangium stoloniferum]